MGGQLSRPYLLALAAVVVFALAWFAFLRPGDEEVPVAETRTTLPAPAVTATGPTSPGPADPARTTPTTPGASTAPGATTVPGATPRDQVLVLAVVGDGKSGDDARVREAVSGLGATGVEVRTLTPDALAADAELAAAAGVDTVPAVVVIDRAGRARVFQGYTDPVTLSEAVAEAVKAG